MISRRGATKANTRARGAGMAENLRRTFARPKQNPTDRTHARPNTDGNCMLTDLQLGF